MEKPTIVSITTERENHSNGNGKYLEKLNAILSSTQRTIWSFFFRRIHLKYIKYSIIRVGLAFREVVKDQFHVLKKTRTVTDILNDFAF